MSEAANKRIAVLMGGRSREREISLITGRECAAALRQAEFRHVIELDIADNPLASIIPERIFSQCPEWAEKIHFQLECRGISRSDFIYDEARGGDGLYFLEINTQLGMPRLRWRPNRPNIAASRFRN